MNAGLETVATLETVDRRVLGAFVCIDAITGTRVMQPLGVVTAAWTVRPNRSAVYVVFSGAGYDSLTAQFVLRGTWPVAEGFEVVLHDPTRRYLARRVTVHAPMSVPIIGPSPGGVAPNPAVATALGTAGAIFNPQRVLLYAAPSAPVGPSWSTIHASVVRQGSSPAVGLPAVLRVVRQSDGVLLSSGQTDANGEALLAVAGLTMQPSTSTTGPVMVATVAVTVTAYVDPASLTQPPDWVANPDDILGNPTNPVLVQGSQTVQMGSGIELTLSFALAV